MYVILSSPIILEAGDYTASIITLDEALQWHEAHSVINYCGHETVRLLGLEPSRSREQCNGYEQALCISANARLEFGREYSAEEIEKIGYTIYLIQKHQEILK